jgi:hypothetical protein
VWSSCNGGLAAADSSIEEDRDRNMVVTITIRAATAIVIRIMAAPLFGRDCVWRVTASVELIGWYPVADMRTQIERAALRRYFSLGKSVTIVAKHPAKTRRHLVKLAGVNRRAPFRSSQTTVGQRTEFKRRNPAKSYQASGTMVACGSCGKPFQKQSYQAKYCSSDHHHTAILTFWHKSEIEIRWKRMLQYFCYRVDLQLVRGGLPSIEDAKSVHKPFVIHALNKEILTDGMHVGAQLPFGGIFGSIDQSFGGAPQQPSRYAENNSEKSDDGFAMRMKPIAAASPARIVQDQETADVFLKGAAASVFLMLLYAGLKRR